jgi:hypothetical protein
VPKKAKNGGADDGGLGFISLHTLAELVDAHRSSVPWWLTEQRTRLIATGRARHGAIRYRWSDIELWSRQPEEVDS